MYHAFIYTKCNHVFHTRMKTIQNVNTNDGLDTSSIHKQKYTTNYANKFIIRIQIRYKHIAQTYNT